MFVTIDDGPAIIADQSPWTRLVVAPDRIERLADVRAITRCNETLEIEGKLLPANAYFKHGRSKRFGQGNEALFKIEPITVDRTFHRLAGREIALELHKGLDPTDPEIRMRFEPAYEIAIRRIARGSKRWRVVGFEAFPKRSAEREIGLRVARRQRDIFECVERLGPQSGIGQDRPIFLPTIEQDGGAGRRLIANSAREDRREQECRHIRHSGSANRRTSAKLVIEPQFARPATAAGKSGSVTRPPGPQALVRTRRLRNLAPRPSGRAPTVQRALPVVTSHARAREFPRYSRRESGRWPTGGLPRWSVARGSPHPLPLPSRG